MAPRSLFSLRISPERVWQVGFRSVAAGLKQLDPELAFVLMLLCDVGKGKPINLTVAKSLESVPDEAAEVVAKACLDSKTPGLPGRIETTDAGVAERLRQLFSGTGVKVDLVQRTSIADALLDDLMHTLADNDSEIQQVLDYGHVPLERVRAYADAAAALYRSAPWRWLSESDVLHVGNVVLPGIGYERMQVLGRAGPLRGVATHLPSPREGEVDEDEGSNHSSLGSVGLLFYHRDHLSPKSIEQWRAFGLPAEDPGGYPMLRRLLPSGRMEIPGAREFTFFEGFCRALADSSEDEIDSGRWEKTVQTFDGPMTFVMSLPPLLEEPGKDVGVHSSRRMLDPRAMEVTLVAMSRRVRELGDVSLEVANEVIKREFIGKVATLPPPQNDLERAQWLCYEAFNSAGRRRIQLARKALTISPDCADAYVILAEGYSFGPEQTLELYRKGVEAGRRALGPEKLENPGVEWWSQLETRPFMRALFGMASVLADLERHDEAIEAYRELLRLNPNDKLGVRCKLATELLRSGRLDELDAFLNRGDYPLEDAAEWQYTRALLAFRRKDPNARQRLADAMASNVHVPRLLLDPEKLPDELPDEFTPGKEDEAFVVASEQLKDWQDAEGALKWLAEVKRQVIQQARKSRTRRR